MSPAWSYPLVLGGGDMELDMLCGVRVLEHTQYGVAKYGSGNSENLHIRNATSSAFCRLDLALQRFSLLPWFDDWMQTLSNEPAG